MDIDKEKENLGKPINLLNSNVSSIKQKKTNPNNSNNTVKITLKTPNNRYNFFKINNTKQLFQKIKNI